MELNAKTTMKRIILFLTLICCIGAHAAQDRPNIIWLTSEDNSHHWIGCYGNEQASTPHIDRLAAEGIRYKYGYANAPVCAVVRNTIITGRYACGMGTQNMRSRYPIPSQFRTFVSYLREAGYYCVNRSKTDYNYQTNDKSHWDESSGKAHWKNRPGGKPFFAVFNSTISHESSLFENKKKGNRRNGVIPVTPRLDPASIELPPHMPDTPEIRQDWVTYMDVVSAMDKQIGGWIKELGEEGVMENTIIIHYSDHGGILPRGKRYIYDTGTHVPMIVRFPKKWEHLAPGEPGTSHDRPVSFIDLPPTALSLARIDVPDQMQGRAFLGGGKRDAEPYVFLFGQRFDSRMLRFVRAVTNGRYRYIRNFHPHRHRGIFTGYPYGQVGWNSFLPLYQAGKTTPAQSSFWKAPQPVEELYDTRSDPWEIKNLANDPKYQERLAEMRQATFNKMREIGDTGLVPEAMYEEISKTGTVYDYVHHKDFPYESVLQMALTAGSGNASDLPKLLQAMKHDHPVIRYWGALGCTVRGESAQAATKQLKLLLEDSVPAVQVVASEALCALGEVASGVQGLVDVLRETDHMIVALEALNIASALNVTRRIPKEVYDRACQIGSYTKRLAGDYPN
jgi:N-sulfoglucosamine sulfohydrolase